MKEKIIDIIKDACAITEDITEESCLKELSLDSLSFIEVVVKIEKTFEIEFDDEDLDFRKWDKIEDIVKKVSDKINEKN